MDHEIKFFNIFFLLISFRSFRMMNMKQKPTHRMEIEIGKDDSEDRFHHNSPTLCKICLESSRKYYQLSCHTHHRYCIICLRKYIDHCLSNGITMIPCPEYQSCDGLLNEKELKDILSSQSYRQYQDYKTYRMGFCCPYCLQIRNPNDPTVSSQICCLSCHKVFCLFHSNAHSPSMTCADYENHIRRADQLSYLLIEKTSQRCPSCQFPTEKVSGRNSMKCLLCKKVSHGQCLWLLIITSSF